MFMGGTDDLPSSDCDDITKTDTFAAFLLKRSGVELIVSVKTPFFGKDPNHYKIAKLCPETE